MNIWQKIRLGREALAVWATAEKEVKMGKSLWKSKTFWLNVVGLVSSLAGVLPAEYSVPALAILNVVNRVLFTDSPIKIGE